MIVVTIENLIFGFVYIAVVFIIVWWRRRNTLKKRLNKLRSGEFIETLEDDALYYPVEEEE